MPFTYHFKPFPEPGEAHLEITPKRPGLSTTPCPCQKEKSRCSKCQCGDFDSVLRQPSQALLSPIKEQPEQPVPGLTPKAIRDRRRASSRASVASIFQSAVASDDYFTLFPNIRSRASGRSDSSSPTRSRSFRRQSSAASSVSRSRSLQQACSPLAESVESSSENADESCESEEVQRRGT